MEFALTDGAIALMSTQQPEDLKPVLQIIEIRTINTQQTATERYRVMLSDGVHVQQGMLATQKNELVTSGRIQKGTIVRLTQFVCNHVQNRIIIIIVDLEVLKEACNIIGDPKIYAPGGTGNTPPVPAGPSPVRAAAEKPNMAVGSFQNSRGGGGGYGSSYGSNADTVSYPSANRSGPYGASYGNQNMDLQNSRADVSSHPPMNSYGRALPGYQQPPPPMYGNRGPVAKNEAPPRIVPIAALNPYQGRWTIKARVTTKGDLRHYNNVRGDGKVFSFDLLDADGGEIRVTCFNAVADQFYNTIELGKVYVISRGSLKPAQKNYNHLKNDYEIHLETTSTVQPCFEDDAAIPKQQFHFCSISDIEGLNNNAIVDVIAIVASVNPTVSIMTKNGNETQKRDLQLKDLSGRSVQLTLWGRLCNEEGQALQEICDAGNFPVLAVKTAKVNEFSGKSIGTIASSQLLIDPDFPEAHRLKEWYDKEGRSIPAVSISRESTSMGRMDNRKTISQIKSEGLGTSDKPDWITVSATVCFVKLDNFCYTACPIKIGDRQCSKKVTNNGDGKWRCDRCDQTVDECDYRYILQFQIQDHTGLTYVTAFQECGEELLGISAKELFLLKNVEQDDDKCVEIVNKVLFERFLFKLKIKEETYNDESRVKSTVVKADKLNFTMEFKHLVDSMRKLKGGDSSSVGVKAENTGYITGANNSYSTNVSMKQPTPAVTNYLGSSTGNYGSGTQTNQRSLYGNQYTGLMAPPLGGSGGGFISSCSSCGVTGHSAANCPSIMSAPPQTYDTGFQNRGSGGGGVTGECYKCHQLGHWARDCPGISNAPLAYGSQGGGLSSGRY